MSLGSAWSERLPAFSLFAAVLSGAGIPIYIYAPKFYADTYGVSLTTLGTGLFLPRLLDAVQDPFFGWLTERMNRRRGLWIALGAVILAASMVGLFAVTPPIGPFWWFLLMITIMFSAFSFLSIAFYAQGVVKAGEEGQLRLAAWRESGALFGVCIAAMAPTLLMDVSAQPFAVFAYGFAAVALVAALAMTPEWRGTVQSEPMGIAAILADRPARRLLVLALVNAAPVAVSSTVFLFYVESALEAPGWEGPLLVLFFLAAAFTSPIWSWLARRYGAKPVLLSAMVLAIVAFGFTIVLGPGDEVYFAVICFASGATIGADLTIMPALFAKRMAQISPKGGQGFGLWALMSKATLAVAAATLLPGLEIVGYEVGASNSPLAINWLIAFYAGVPVLLKVVAILLLLRLRLPD